MPRAWPSARVVAGPRGTCGVAEYPQLRPDLVTTEVLGLQTALARAPVELALDLRRLNGDLLRGRLIIPDEVSALTFNAFAMSIQMKPTDIIDVLRCLEVCFAAGVTRARAQRSSASYSTSKAARGCGR